MKLTRTEPDKTPHPPRYRMSARLMWAVVIVWVVIFFMIRAALHIGGNPIIIFLLMFGLFFVVLTGLRIGLVRYQVWWRNFKPVLQRWLGKS